MRLCGFVLVATYVGLNVLESMEIWREIQRELCGVGYYIQEGCD